MGSLLNTILSAAGALRAYDQVLSVTQNNVANANTPGFVKHRQSLLARPFDPATGAAGGVVAGDVQSSRNAYADQSVRHQVVLLGQAQQDVESLTSLQSIFDISGDSGLPRALNDLYKSFSAWAQSPNDGIVRQSVLDRAADVAAAFRQTASAMDDAEHTAERGASGVVDTINTLVSRLQSLNRIAKQGSRADSSLDAQIHSTLEDLSEYVDVTVTEADDGSVNVLLNGQIPLLVGTEQLRLTTRVAQPDPGAPYPNAPGSLHVYAGDGSDITAQVTTGRLGSLLDTRNRLLPSYLGDANQPGDLNRMAAQFADRVNSILTAANISDGPPPVAGAPLFQYSADPTSTARTLAAAPISAGELAAIDPGPPYVSNGAALSLAGLASPQSDADKIDGVSYAQFFGSLAGRAGAALDDAQSRQAVQQSAVAQTRSLRDQMSGVSLDEEAVILIQFQRAYEAGSRLITVLQQLSEDAINILR